MVLKQHQEEVLKKILKVCNIEDSIVESNFKQGYLEKLVCNRTTKTWTFHVSNLTIIPCEVYKLWNKNIMVRFPHIEKCEIIIDFGKEVDISTIIDEYWNLLEEWIESKGNHLKFLLSQRLGFLSTIIK
ncbi:PolC-type DNA polymerase III N-terminal domain-containing protein [Lederbergia sp. NSJ-179]|uniref:PolC-type DNA polymerase III N-terminal domain-containing protein n=1 Tax=Lederbergia sp. NSJ-179 TaxID=2931402 RepID=UPI0028BDF0C5|nr:PolC-type DNA polymerase III N-terminal domain-containing protein [Lederbergia sp. NSJ-179]